MWCRVNNSNVTSHIALERMGIAYLDFNTVFRKYLFYLYVCSTHDWAVYQVTHGGESLASFPEMLQPKHVMVVLEGFMPLVFGGRYCAEGRRPGGAVSYQCTSKSMHMNTCVEICYTSAHTCIYKQVHVHHKKFDSISWGQRTKILIHLVIILQDKITENYCAL